MCLGQSLHAAAAIKLIHGPLSNAFKGSFSVGFVLFSFQSFRVFEETQLSRCVCTQVGLWQVWVAVLGAGCREEGDPGILGLRDNEVFGESVFSPPFV